MYISLLLIISYSVTFDTEVVNEIMLIFSIGCKKIYSSVSTNMQKKKLGSVGQEIFLFFI